MNQDSHFSRYSFCPISLFIEPILTTRCFKRNLQRTKKPFSVDLKSLKIHNRKYTASKKLHIADSINSCFFLLLYLGLGFWDLSSPVFHEKSKNTIIGKSATYIGQDWIGLIFSLHEKKAHCGSE